MSMFERFDNLNPKLNGVHNTYRLRLQIASQCLAFQALHHDQQFAVADCDQIINGNNSRMIQ